MRHQQIGVHLWSFRHSRGDTIECSVNQHPVGLEFRAEMNAELLHRQVFRSPEELLHSTERGNELLTSRGWTLITAASDDAVEPALFPIASPLRSWTGQRYNPSRRSDPGNRPSKREARKVDA